MKFRGFVGLLLGASLLMTLGCKGDADATGTPFAASTEQPSGAPLTLQGRVNDAAGALTSDAVCEEIMEQEIVPHFRRGDYDGGLEAGVSALIARLH